MLVMVSACVPMFESVTDCAAVEVPIIVCTAKFRLEVERETVEGGDDPLKLTVCGLLLALSVTVSVPVRVPDAVGVKITLMTQLVPGAMLAVQLLVWAKSPLAAMLDKVSVPVPELVSMTVWPALGVPTVWLVKVRLEGASDTAGVVGVGVGLLRPLPQPDMKVTAAISTSVADNLAVDESFHFLIAPPPVRGWREEGWARRRVLSRPSCGRR
jgi:hypothetical protein